MPTDFNADNLALAIDVGTSFVEVALVDLDRRSVRAHARDVNQQVFFGTNVLSRLSSALEGSTEDLQRAAQGSVISAIGKLDPQLPALTQFDQDIEQNVDRLQVAAEAILSHVEMIVVAGNSVMAPLFCGVAPRNLAQAPFTPHDIAWCETGPLVELWREARENNALGIQMLQPLDAFVGGDARAALIATGLADRSGESASLLVDLGTNAEIMLRDGGDLYVTSVPAGPTFEGVLGGIGGKLRGTDVIELLADRLTIGAIDNEGLVLDEEAALPHTQDDVREIQLAKAAVRTGIDMLLEHAQIRPERLDSFSLVGAFGRNLDAEAARAIGLFAPELPIPSPPSFMQVTDFESADLGGVNNAALIGAIKVALGCSTDIEGAITHLDLVNNAEFSTTFINALPFALPQK